MVEFRVFIQKTLKMQLNRQMWPFEERVRGRNPNWPNSVNPANQTCPQSVKHH
jgi:hypothetical protein